MLFLFTVHCSLFTVLSCTRTTNNNNVTPIQKALPSAILHTGEHPLWFQLTESGTELLETIEDAQMSAAFVPWPYALHVRFLEEREGELVMAVNRDGFLKITPAQEDGLAMYRFSGGSFWNQYTVGSFLFFNESPVALLYLDDRFLAPSSPLPNPRTWTFDMKSNAVFSIKIPVLEIYPADEGWNADTLRLGDDGFFYYRVRRESPYHEVHILKTENPFQAGIVASIDDFFHSAVRKTEVNHESLPPLPEGFVYTEIARIAGSLFACWEEQEEYNIGAAGFMLLKEHGR